MGPLQVRQYGLPVTIPGAKPRAILTLLGLHGASVVPADVLVELLWGGSPPRTAVKALQTHISSLRHALGDGFVLTEGTGWRLSTTEIDASRYKLAARMGRDAIAAGDTSGAVARFDEALTLWRGSPELPDSSRGVSEKTRWIEGHAALVEDRADALLATGRAAEIIGDLEAAIADAPLRERRWGQLMLALYRAGRQGESLGAFQRARSLLADELGVDPGPELRRLEAAIVAQDVALEIPVSQQLTVVTRAVTFLLTDIEGSTAAWEADADAMAAALARHDELVEQLVTSRGGRLIKTRGEGDATFSVFDRPSAGAAAAIELQEAIRHEPWALSEPLRIRVALHTGEVELRDGDYFGRAVNRAARLRSLAAGDQILCSGATAELVIDSLADDVVLADLGMRQLRNLARPEHVFELRLETSGDSRPPTTDTPMERPGPPAVLAGPGPFVGRGRELERLFSTWQNTLAGGTTAVLIAGEPGVGKTRLAGEWSRQAYEHGAVVLYGRCDEDLGAPYQPFAEALRSLVPCLGANRLRALRGVEALLSLVPGLTDLMPDLAAPTRADPDTERYALFDAVVEAFGTAAANAPIVLVLDDLHWAGKPTLLLLRHLLRFGDGTRIQIVGTYRSTDLDRSHPLAAMLADLHRSAGSGSATRLQLGGLDEDDVTAYVAGAGYDDEELARALASVTGGNPFFLIEALRHVDESGGRWDPSTLPQGVREAVSRRLSRLSADTNKALAAAAVVGSRFAIELVERVIGDDLVDAFDDACKAGIIIEEPGGLYRFNHAIVRQSLLAELASVRRMRLHQRIAATLENEPQAEDELLAELAYHYFECAWAGNAAKAVDYCRRAADQAMARLAYEGAAELYDRALHALEELDEELPDRDDQQAELLVARCEALLAAGDVASAAGAVSQLQEAAGNSARLAAWGTCFDGQLSMLTDPERLDEIEASLGSAAERLAGLEDAAGEAKAQTVRAACLGRLGRVADCESALDQALTAARRAGDHRQVNAVLAGAPLAALWGPNPVPRAGGRCLDVVRLLRITTGSPVVEATSTRCQGVLDAFRGRAAAGRQLIDSARRSLTELGMRHALLEVDQFAGIVELVADDPAAAEPYLRRACDGFRRMGLDADTAETAALLARACLALDRGDDADELCTESERLAGHDLKASITWRTVRAQLLARAGAHEEARRVAEEAVAIAARTDALVDHGDACLALATVLGAAGDASRARAAAEQAVGLYELKGAAALAEKARDLLGKQDLPTPPAASAQPEAPVEIHSAAIQAFERAAAAVDAGEWDEFERLFTPSGSVESRRKLVGFKRTDFSQQEVIHQTRSDLENGIMRAAHVILAVRGKRLALARVSIGTVDESPGAPQDEFLQLCGVDDEGRIALQIWFDLDDIEAALAELDAIHARSEDQSSRLRLENTASRAEQRLNALFAESRWDDIGAMLSDDIVVEERRQAIRRESNGRATLITEMRVIADLGVKNTTSEVLATRGDRLVLSRVTFTGRDKRPDAFRTEILRIGQAGADERMVATVTFDPGDLDAAFEELDARYLAGEAAAHDHTWSMVVDAYAGFNRRELAATPPDWVNIDHRRGAGFAPGEMIAYMQAAWDDSPDTKIYIEAVHRLSGLGAVVTHVAHGISQEGFNAEWRDVHVLTVKGDSLARSELFDEADLDAALARFDELSQSARRLENAATRAFGRFESSFFARDWDAIAEAATDNLSIDDRRRIVNVGIRYGRETAVQDLQATADIGFALSTSGVTAIRGELLALVRVRGSGTGPEAIQNDVLNVVEVDADGRTVAVVVFDPDDIDAAFAELDALYLAGEAATHPRTWSAIASASAALNRHELPNTTSNFVDVDHRRAANIDAGGMEALLRTALELTPVFSSYIENVHELSDLGGVITQVAHGTSQEGFDAEWRIIGVLTVAGESIDRCEVFDESDLDAALAKFHELSQPTPRLENAASRVYERFNAHLRARDWNAMAELLAEDVCDDDRRRVVNIGIQRGRDTQIANLRAVVDVGVKDMELVTIATRGERLALTRTHVSGSDQRSEPFGLELLSIIEIAVDGRIAAGIAFDTEDLDAAFAELDGRYLAGEAAPYGDTWSAVIGAYTALNRREFPETAPDHVSIDHRRVTSFAPGDIKDYTRLAWNQMPDISFRIAAVRQLTGRGAVVTHALRGTSRQGFEAEWREIHLMVIEGGLFTRSEMFDESDLDTALARFDDVTPPTPRLQNAATREYERFNAYYVTGDWKALGAIISDDFCADDRRRLVGLGRQQGRDAVIAHAQVTAELGVINATSTVVATRAERLALMHSRFWGDDNRPDAFDTEVLHMIEIDAERRVTAFMAFDVDDLDAALAELDARYLAGEAGEHAHTWSAITGGYSAFNRHEMPSTTPDWVNVDHRRARAFAPGNLTPYIRATWDLAPQATVSVEAVHRLSDVGAVVCQVTRGSSSDGFDFEWREIALFTVDGDWISRIEVFDEADLDIALARFDELGRSAKLSNIASRVFDRFQKCLAEADLDAMANLLADDICSEDRRHIVNSGIRHGRDAALEDARVIAGLGAGITATTVLATRGERLALRHSQYAVGHEQTSAYQVNLLEVVELDTDEQIAAVITFEPDDLDAAFAELDARYLAGEAAAHSQMWSVMRQGYAALNRHEVPAATPDWVTIDHRVRETFEADDLAAYIRSAWDVAPDVKVYIEAVHRLSNLGAVVTHTADGRSRGGFVAEWRIVELLMTAADGTNRCELFDEADLNIALARFDELGHPATTT